MKPALVVIDTNVLVSALWSNNGNPRKILDLLLNGKIKPCYGSGIIKEYEAVLSRPHFQFTLSEVSSLLSFIKATGISVVPAPTSVQFIDEDDRKFYEVAKCCNAVLITGNLKHFPKDQDILAPVDYIKIYNSL